MGDLMPARPGERLRHRQTDGSEVEQECGDALTVEHGCSIGASFRFRLGIFSAPRYTVRMQDDSFLPPDVRERLRTLLHVFLAENEKLNLTALRAEEACWIGNILDSLAFLSVPDSSLTADRSLLLDLGTGGGFPLLPIAIALPEIQCTGLDSVRKKIDAVGRIVQTMELRNVTLIAERSEILGKVLLHREHYDIVLSRAVAPLSILLEYASPFVKPGGSIVLWKSLHIDEELEKSGTAQREFRCPLSATHRYALPGDFGERQLLIFRKEGPLSKRYPRAIGDAKREPV